MKLLTTLLFATALAAAQPIAITSTTTITASVGTLVCTGTPGVNAQSVSTMHMACTSGGATLHTSDSTVPSTPGTGIAISVSSGASSITWLLTKGNPAPDGWSVSVTDGTATKSKTGTF